MTEQEALAVALAEQELVKPVNDILMIDPETRTINVPDSERLFGVQSDEKAERKYFKCPKIVGNNINLATMNLYINYKSPNQADEEGDSYIVQDVVTSGDYITFSWVLGRNVTKYTDGIHFSVCAKKSNSDGTLTTEWNTTWAEGEVLEGLETTQQIAEKNKDLIEQLLNTYDSKVAVKLEFDPATRGISII